MSKVINYNCCLFDNLIIIRFARSRSVAAPFSLIADAQGTNAH